MSSAIKTSTGSIAAGARFPIAARGSFLYLRSSTDELVVEASLVDLGQKTGQTTKVRMSSGDKIRPAQEFDQVSLYNDSATTVTFELVTGDGDYDRPTPDTVNVQVSSSNNNAATTNVDETNIDVGSAGAALLLAQNNQRVNAWITALATNGEEIRIGDANVDTDRGTPLQPGDTILWSSKGACYACSIATVDQGASVTEFTE